MLEPRDRQLIFDALRPPLGYQFDEGIATTYSLDLLALMMAPVAFTMFDLQAGEEGASQSSLEVLEGLRRYADRLTLFCDAGRISVPRGRHPQLAFVEDSVVQCRAPNGGSFHSKLWVLRFVGDGPVRYRVLVLTRNLMFCRAWDTMLALDGEVGTSNVAATRPLADFIRALPSTALIGSTAVSARATALADDLLRVRFEHPEDISGIRFWPIGLAASKTSPFKGIGKRLLIVAPFVGVTAVEALAKDLSECQLVSTVPQLSGLARRPEGVSKFFVLNERAVAESEETAAALSDSMADAIAQADLHAKLFITEHGGDAHVWTGSANATDAAFRRNVEFLVELTGPRKQFGIDALMAREKDKIRLIDLLRDVTDAGLVAATPADPEVVALEKRLEEFRIALIDAAPRLQVSETDGAFNLSMTCLEPLGIDSIGITVSCWPITTESARTELLEGASEELATFGGISFEALTSFIAFEAAGSLQGVNRKLRFVLNLPMSGAPVDRKDRVLRSFLGDRGRFLRFLMLLLAEEGMNPGGTEDGSSESDESGKWAVASAGGLLEMLLNTLDSNPRRLDHLASLLRQVKSDPTAGDLLPEGFDAVWDPIWRHREGLIKGSER